MSGAGGDAPLAPMLAKLVRELPEGDYIYEPKWDGFRCLARRTGDNVELRSRHGRPLARYFPEIVTRLRALGRERFTLDGEVLVVVDGRFDFAALMSRLHPAASRVRALAEQTPAVFVAFNLLEDEHGFLLGGGPMGRLKGAAGRWAPGMEMDWLPLAPERVAEVRYTQVDGRRLRHPARFVRWRPDRDPASCRVEQLDAESPPNDRIL